MTLILSNDEVASIFSMRACIDALEEGYRELALGRAANAPRTDMFFPTKDPDTFYKFKCIQGGIPTMGVVGQRTQSDIDHFYHQNGDLKLADHRGRYLSNVFLYSMETLELLAIVQDGELQRKRVAGTCAIGAKYLADENAKILGLYGAGFQAASMVDAMCAVRDIQQVRVFSPTKARRLRFCKEMSEKFDLEVLSLDQPAEVVRGADIVACATNSVTPGSVCKGDWLSGGAYLTCIKYREFDATAYEKSDRIFFTNMTEDFSHFYRLYVPKGLQVPERSGRADGQDREFYSAFSSKMYSLEELLVGKTAGRKRADETIMYMKGMGNGTEFTATAKAVYDLACQSSVGREIPNEWLSQVTHPPLQDHPTGEG